MANEVPLMDKIRRLVAAAAEQALKGATEADKKAWGDVFQMAACVRDIYKLGGLPPDQNKHNQELRSIIQRVLAETKPASPP